jgi:hypothetical protein
MSPVVRISDGIFERLQKLAVPLVDSVGDVIARLLDEHEGRGRNVDGPDRRLTDAGRDPMVVAKENVITASSTSELVHPDYSRATTRSRALHDAIKAMLTREFGADVRVDQRTLVFRSHDKNFAAIQRLGLRTEVVDLSIFGEHTAFEDPLGLVTQGRFPHWSKIRIEPSTDLDEVGKIVRQSHSIRLRRPPRDS